MYFLFVTLPDGYFFLLLTVDWLTCGALLLCMIASLGVVARDGNNEDYMYYSNEYDDHSGDFYSSEENNGMKDISEDDINAAIKEAQQMYKHNIMKSMTAYFNGKYIKDKSTILNEYNIKLFATILKYIIYRAFKCF